MKRPSPLLTAALLAATICSPAHAWAQPTPTPTPTPVPAPAPTPPADLLSLAMPDTNNGQLTELAAQIVIVHDVPGVAVAIIDRAGVRAMGVAGVRKAGEPERLQPEDRMHLGSCGKAMTAALLARLVDQGKLSFDDTLAKLLPDLKLAPGWEAVTLRDLLTHRAGISSAEDEQQLPFLWAMQDDVVASRAKLAERILTAPPTGTRGTFAYSNVAYTIAGHVAERVTGREFEELMAAEVFEPLKIGTAGFGAPGVFGKVVQPYGHRAGSGPIAPGPVGDNPPGLSPAGRIHMSVRDWGKFVAVFLGGGPDGYLKPATLAELLRPVGGSSPTDPAYAMGWGLNTTRGRPTLSHAGSNTFWFSQVLAFPKEPTGVNNERGWAVLVVTNQGGRSGEKACVEITQEVVSLAKP